MLTEAALHEPLYFRRIPTDLVMCRGWPFDTLTTDADFNAEAIKGPCGKGDTFPATNLGP